MSEFIVEELDRPTLKITFGVSDLEHFCSKTPIKMLLNLVERLPIRRKSI